MISRVETVFRSGRYSVSTVLAVLTIFAWTGAGAADPALTGPPGSAQAGPKLEAGERLAAKADAIEVDRELKTQHASCPGNSVDRK